MRIVSICPSNTELCAYLGLTENLVGVDDYSDWPEAVLSLPKLGPDLSIDMDKVEALKPDLVLASLSVPGMEKNVDALKDRSIPHVVFNPNSLEEIAEDLMTLGRLTGKVAEATSIVQKYNKLIDGYKEISKNITKKPSLYWEWWPKPVFTPGKINWLTKISELAGATNLYDDVELASVQTDWQDVVNRKPDHICLAWVGVKQDKVKPALVKKREGWDTLYEEKKCPIHVLEEPLYCRPSPRLLTGLQKLAAIIHPQHYPAYSQDQDALLTARD
ncbi:cobalamin-binding protein [Pseudalkalibacillus caeni]|uniref:Cobalamin-binding protein n=1 Tax=Exobacillus caeni TaxID=2574798 RepID=A0A5R9F751_9BACL|nr:cobalamin-binding protein [Pseudalkalibacillus caeni]TLS38861.1 cobalamin-binding protein [Pseudalkalibacillus caeni]